MNRPTRTLAALTSAAALTVAGMSPASAALWAHDDAVGDVETYTYTWDNKGNETVSGPNPSPANTNTDITRVTVRHGARRLVLSTALRDITTNSGAVVYNIRTDNRAYAVQQRLGTDRSLMAFDFSRLNGDPIRCSGVRRSVDRTTEKAVVSIPRRCLGRPRWVRVEAHAFRYSETRTGSTAQFDWGLSDEMNPDRMTFSPRIRRG
jgi:hypothetical protein